MTAPTITFENVRGLYRATIKAAYASGKNTYGHVGHVIEKREAGSKEESDWIPLEGNGTMVFGNFEVPDIRSPGTFFVCKIMCYENGQLAAQFYQYLKEFSSGETFRIKRYQLPPNAADSVEASNTWKKREASRFADGTYTPLPFAEEPWFKVKHASLCHFAHVSVEDKGMIAYTRDNSQGMRNAKTRVSVGRYLQEHFRHELSDMPSRETDSVNVHGEKITVDALQWYVKTFNNQYGGGSALKFATTRDEIAEVYKSGPVSCMAHNESQYSTDGIHPTEVYAAGDLHLAYLVDESADERITARALVWPEKKAVGRIYGDHMALSSELYALGYNREDSESLYGARLLKIKHGKGYVMPYIDGCGTYGQHPVDKDCFKIGGGKDATYTHGLDHDESEYCAECGDGVDPDYGFTVYVNRHDEDQVWCERCAENSSFCCAASGNRYADRVPHISLSNGEYVSRHNARVYFECAINGEWYHMDDAAGRYENTAKLVSMDGADGLMADDDGTLWEPDNFPVTLGDEIPAERAA
jgi:hypothetical protein